MGFFAVIGIAAAVCAAGAVTENLLPLTVTKDCLPFPIDKRIVQVSDLHRRRFGRHNEKLIAAVRQQNPEIIAVTGDLVSRNTTDLTETERLLAAFREIAPIVMCLGNHELDLPPELFAAYREMLRRQDVLLLDNETAETGGVRFAGLTLTHEHYKNGHSYRNLRTCSEKEISAALGECQAGTILLAHNPLFFEAYAEWGADLVLSGHVHGGAVRLPLLGGVLSPERKFFPKYDKGVFRLKQSIMVVSGGLGKLRLGNRPEIRVLDLTADGERMPHS